MRKRGQHEGRDAGAAASEQKPKVDLFHPEHDAAGRLTKKAQRQWQRRHFKEHSARTVVDCDLLALLLTPPVTLTQCENFKINCLMDDFRGLPPRDQVERSDTHETYLKDSWLWRYDCCVRHIRQYFENRDEGPVERIALDEAFARARRDRWMVPSRPRGKTQRPGAGPKQHAGDPLTTPRAPDESAMPGRANRGEGKFASTQPVNTTDDNGRNETTEIAAGLTPLARKLLRAYFEMGAVDPDHSVGAKQLFDYIGDTSNCVVDEDSARKPRQELRTRGYLVGRRRAGSWITELGAAKAKQYPPLSTTDNS